MTEGIEKNIELELNKKPVLPQLLDFNVGRKSTLHLSHPDACRLFSGEQQLERLLAGEQEGITEDMKLALEFYTSEYSLGYFFTPKITLLDTIFFSSLEIFAQKASWVIFKTKIRLDFDLSYDYKADFYTLVAEERKDNATFLRIAPISLQTAEEIKNSTKNALEIEEDATKKKPSPLQQRNFLTQAKQAKSRLTKKGLMKASQARGICTKTGKESSEKKTKKSKKRFKKFVKPLLKGATVQSF